MGTPKQTDGQRAPALANPTRSELVPSSLDDLILELIAHELQSKGSLSGHPDNDSHA